MEFSYNYANNALDFCRAGNAVSALISGAEFIYNQNCVKYIVIPKANLGDRVVIPSLIANRYIRQKCYDKECVVPLNIDTNTVICSGPDGIIKAFNRISEVNRLIKVTKGNETYYGAKGIILDKDFNILLLSAFDFILSYTPDGYMQSTINSKMYISPRVFTDDSKSLNKAIARKLVPFYLTPTQYVDKPKVIIEECPINIVFKAPKKPVNILSLNKDLNSFLKSNIDDVLTQVKNDFREHIR